jgi:Spy/CpxP family protein refolding chaperone
MNVRPLVTLSVILSAVTYAHAQPPPVAVDAGVRGSPMGILRLEQVQEELKLTPQQRAQLQQLAAEVRQEVASRIAAIANAPPDQRAAQIADTAATAGPKALAYRQRVDEILAPDQKARLRQVMLQVRGPVGALADDQVAAALNLNDDQKARLREIRQRVGASVLEAMQDLRERRVGAESQLDPKAREVYRDAVEQSLGLLTPSQRDAFEKLQGDKFELDQPRARPLRRGLIRERLGVPPAEAK